jgi:hypothetical protein
MDQETVRMFFRQRLPELLERPFGSGMRRHIVMKNLPPSHLHDHHYIKDAESACDHDEEVAGHYRLGVIANESQPSLTRIRRPAADAGQILLYRAGGNPYGRMPLLSAQDSVPTRSSHLSARAEVFPYSHRWQLALAVTCY